jgi:hypothetical protein
MLSAGSAGISLANVKSRQVLPSLADNATIWIEIVLHKFEQSLVLSSANITVSAQYNKCFGIWLKIWQSGCVWYHRLEAEEASFSR